MLLTCCYLGIYLVVILVTGEMLLAMLPPTDFAAFAAAFAWKVIIIIIINHMIKQHHYKHDYQIASSVSHFCLFFTSWRLHHTIIKIRYITISIIISIKYIIIKCHHQIYHYQHRCQLQIGLNVFITSACFSSSSTTLSSASYQHQCRHQIGWNISLTSACSSSSFRLRRLVVIS